MTVTSIVINPETGQPYRSGDKLETREQAIAFFDLLDNWEGNYIDNAYYVKDVYGHALVYKDILYKRGLPYTVVGFSDDHVAKTATPLVSVSKDELIFWAKEGHILNKHFWVYDPTMPKVPSVSFSVDDAWDLHTLLSRMDSGLRVYEYDPAKFPPA